MTAEPPAIEQKRPREPFGTVAFCLAVFLMVLPVEVDILYSLLHQRMFTAMKVLWVVCFLAVFVPLVLSWRRLRQKPPRYRGVWRLVFVGVVLVVNIMAAISFWNLLPK